MRWFLSIPLLLTLALTACAGATDPATDITNLSATLNAHGHTTGQPATWWWEYSTNKSDLGTANDTEVCGKETDNRCGPATSSTDVTLHVSVTGLTPDTTYWFRACGQDEGGSPACGQALSFKTLAGTGYAFDGNIGVNQDLSFPYGVGTDPDANVYVADALGYQIVKFARSGDFIRRWGSGGTGPGQFDRPSSVVTDAESNVYVADLGNNRVQKFSTTGQFIRQWGRTGTANGAFNSPYAIATDADGNVYVVDEGNYRVQKFSGRGEFIRTWGSSGSGPGQFTNPEGIAVDGVGNVYVSDAVANRVQRFTVKGELLGAWGSSGSGPGQLRNPAGVATDSAGGVYVADSGNGRVQTFTPTGDPVATIGPAAGSQAFDMVTGVATDKFGNVYLVAPDHIGIAKFKPVE